MNKHAKQPDGTPDNMPQGLDALLREWHDVNADRAADGRDLLVERLREARRADQARAAAPRLPGPFAVLAGLARRMVVNRYTPALASLTFLIVIIALLVPRPGDTAYADVVMVPEGGRLDARDADGNLLGVCPLTHTDVDVRVSGFMSRVTVTQTYRNPYSSKIEAVYTFPLSHRAAVDRMSITVGDRVVVGEVKERGQARRIYEAARAQGYVASLLEQQRPNIFTQSVANIEPDAEVVVKISYVEMLASRDGLYTFDFPMVVGPRYIPGAPVTSPSIVPAELRPHGGLILLGPAELTVGAAGDTSPGTIQPGKLAELLAAAQAIHYPGDTWWGRGDVTGGAGTPDLWYRFEAAYASGREFGQLYTDGTGQLNGRWFYTDPAAIEGMGTGFARNTNEVPDASLITPMPVKPPTRAGHDVSVRVTIDAGGPGVVDVSSGLHDVEIVRRDFRADGTPGGVTVTLANSDEIPNRDFVLSWRQTADTIEESTFTHTSESMGEWSGGFFTLIVQPPDRIAETDVPPRELIFVMDTSGSMSGFPFEKSKAVMTRAIDAMRPADTFNVITFAGHTAVLWDTPKPATPANRDEARAFVASRQSGGGTEMMKAIDAALVQDSRPMTPRGLLDLPADNRRVEVAVPYDGVQMTGQPGMFRIPVGDDLAVQLRVDGDLPTVFSPHGVTLRVDGRWRTANGHRELFAERVSLGGDERRPLRLVLFLTDGYVGNEAAIFDAVRRNALTTRVFSFGIGNSVNRHLLDGMARAGRGESEIVLLNADADEAVERFTKRIETPVLTDISLEFSEGLHVLDLLPAPDAIPDLFDVKPLVIHGRYTEPGRGTVTIRGRTGAGAYERVLELDLPEAQADHDVIATLWARAKVDQVLEPHAKQVSIGAAPQPVKDQIVALGEQFSIMTQFTSFVAVEKSRMTLDGEPVLVAVPIELPDGVAWEGIFGNVVNGFAERDGRLEPMLGDIPMLGRLYTFGIETQGRDKHNALLSTTSSKRQFGQDARGLWQRVEPGVLLSTAAAATDELQAEKPLAVIPVPPTFMGRGEAGAKNNAVRSKSAGKRSAPGSGGSGFGGGSADGPAGRHRKAGRQDVDGKSVAAGRAGSPLPGSRAAPPSAPKSAGLEKDEAAAAPVGKIEKSADFKEALREAEEPAAGLAMEFDAVNGPGQDPATVVGGWADDREEEVNVAAKLNVLQEPDILDELVFRKAAPQEQTAHAKRVLHPALLLLVTGNLNKQAALEDRENKTADVLVTVLVTGVSDAAVRDALSKAGLSIKGWSKSLPIVVGTVAVEDLEKLANVAGVRRIEPTRITRERVARPSER